MTSQTQTEHDRAERTAYVAIDAIQLLCDRGYGGLDTERAFEHIRALLSMIEGIPIRTRNASRVN